MTTGPYICGFESIGLTDRARVGGKGASLAELTRAGLRVPAGFVITTQAFAEFMAAVDPRDELAPLIESAAPDDLGAIAQSATQARQRIGALPMPPELRQPIASAYRQLCAGDTTTVAVRSSATSEDSAEASFAGLQDTYLWIRDEESMLGAVRDCWASLYSVESVTYRRQRSLPERHIAMAVVVQRMDFREETTGHRKLCGTGEFDVKGFVKALENSPYRGPIGIEVLSKELRSWPLDRTVTEAYRTTRAQFD